MNDESNLAGFNSEIESRMRELLSDGYELNLEQYKVLVDMIKVFANLPSSAKCKIDHIGLKKEELRGGITVSVSYLDLECDQLKEFGNCITKTSAFEFGAKSDRSLYVSFTVLNVYRRVRGQK